MGQKHFFPDPRSGRSTGSETGTETGESLGWIKGVRWPSRTLRSPYCDEITIGTTTSSVTRGKFRPCIPPHSLPCTARTIDLERRSSRAVARRRARTRTRRAPQHLCTDGSACLARRFRSSGQRRLPPSPDRRRRPPRTRGQSSDFRQCRRSRSTFALSVHVMGSVQSRVGRSYMACIAGSSISKETAPFAATSNSPSSVDLSNTSW